MCSVLTCRMGARKSCGTVIAVGDGPAEQRAHASEVIKSLRQLRSEGLGFRDPWLLVVWDALNHDRQWLTASIKRYIRTTADKV